jgi:hypothetical protein
MLFYFRILAIFLLTTTISQVISAQEMTISGLVVDTTETVEKPLPNAVAMLVRIRDSVMVDFRRTDFEGKFKFENIKLDTLQLLVSHPRFNEQSYYLFGSQNNREFPIKRIVLPQKSTQLKEVVIYAFKDPVYYKGDTLVYVADSFATAPNAVVEDLLKKLPGIKVGQDGALTSQGKEIAQVLVDGDEFFGSDPTIATKNLAANGVESVQVYEKKNENAAEGEEETIQVLDLKLKDDAKKGYFGKVSAATDFQRFYESEFLANKFNKKQKISVFNLVSNTTRSSLEWRDAYKYGISGGWEYNEEEDIWTGGENESNGTGVPQTWKSGVYFTDNFNNKTDLSINYTFGNNSLLTEESKRSQYFLSDTSYVTDEMSEVNSKQQSHALNLKVKHQLDSLTTLEVEGKFQRKDNERIAIDETTFLNALNVQERTNAISNSSIDQSTAIDSRFLLTRNFKKKNRKFTLSYKFGFDDTNLTGTLLSKNEYTDLQFTNDTTSQSKDNFGRGINHRINTAYTEPLSKKVKFTLDYEFYNGISFQEKLTYNQQNGGSNQTIDSTFSNAFNTVRNQHRAGAQFQYEHKKHLIVVGAKVRDVNLDNLNEFTDSTLLITDVAILPRFRYTLKFSQNNRLSFNYNTSSSLPTISQIQPVPDNTNPNRLVLGNPDLVPNFVHRASLTYNIHKPVSGKYLWSSLSYNYIQHAFSNAVQFDAFGRTLSQTINVEGNYNVNLYVGGGFSIFKKAVEVNPSINAGINRYNSYINNELNSTINQNLGANVEFTVESDSLEVSFGGGVDYNNPISSISTATNLPYYTQDYNLAFRWKLPARFILESEATYTRNSRLTSGYNVNFLLWNAAIHRNFLKNENLIASVYVYDIMNQNISAGRSVSSNIITDRKTNIIARYFLVKMTFKFNNSKTKETDDVW